MHPNVGAITAAVMATQVIRSEDAVVSLLMLICFRLSQDSPLDLIHFIQAYVTALFPVFYCFSAHNIVESIEMVSLFLREQVLSIDDFECCLTPALSFLRKEGYFDVITTV